MKNPYLAFSLLRPSFARFILFYEVMILKRIISLIVTFGLLLGLISCGSTPPQTDSNTLRVACTTYPVYLLAQAVTQGVDSLELSLVIDQQISCLHNYSLTMDDMKAVEAADVIAINGADMEDFLEDVLEGRQVLDCSASLDLLWNDEEQEYDPHFWLDPDNAALMAKNLADGLAELDPDNAGVYTANTEEIQLELADFHQTQRERLKDLQPRELITFHDGFEYFAQAFDLEIAASVEEEEGSEASAQRIKELLEIVDEYDLPAVFTESNGPDSAARALSDERDLAIFALNMGMSRDLVPDDLTGVDAYEWLIAGNIDTLLEAYQ